ncbi:hypothetical protein JQ633_32665 [Bradyrhizobium tropiciagri]|uniref:hypothetical protein n=1 Tax=Bradyrhizobium tropiciagri TaxID=312253 RepID=UPI001BA4BEB4|nr:hypothetical protein [Bradyrhizobium tropiciagri]MBR0875152.1 hypothetical protein [Bradyrhizobium tropiciagri]
MDETIGTLSERRLRTAGFAALAFVVVLWLGVSALAVSRQGTWPDEAAYILKSWWYVSGAVRPYSAEDATWYQPLIYYVIGLWQWMVGHGVIASRSDTVLITAINIGLLAGLLRRLNCGIWPIVFAIIVFALTEDSVFYFSSATPYAFAICLQLIALHLMLTMRGNAGYALAIALGVVLTMIYFVRINLVSFIALSLAIVWVRAGRDRWRVYAFAAGIFVATWLSLAWLWGQRFVYVSLWFPIVTDWLSRAGVMPYPHAMSLSQQLLMQGVPSRSLPELLSYMFGPDMMLNWLVAHHVVPLAAAVFALGVLVFRRSPNRGWIATFLAAYLFLLLFHHFGAQSYCPICIQGYANYFNYFGALAGALALSGWSGPPRRKAPGGPVAAGAVAAALVLASLQSWYLSGSNRLPSIRNQASALPSEVRRIGAALKGHLPANSLVGLVSMDPRIPLALADADARISPVALSLTSFYRKLNDNLTAEQKAVATAEIAELSLWTDSTAENWMRNDYEFLLVQRRPDRFPSWLIWAPDAPLVTRGLAKCFERIDARAFDDVTPPLSVELYRRTGRGDACVSD